MQEELKNYIRAAYPLLYLVSSEESRVEECLRSVAKSLQKKCLVWSLTRGFVDIETGQPAYKTPEMEAPTNTVMRGLDYILQNADKASYLFVLKDFHPYLKRENPMFIRKVRDVTNALTSTRSNLLILSPVIEIPPELEKECTVVDFPLPELSEIQTLVEKKIIEFTQQGAQVQLDDKGKENICKSLMGLTLTEMENAIALATVKDAKLASEDLSDILREKEQLIKKSGILEFYPVTEKMDHVGGLDSMKNWLKKKRFALSEEAFRYGLENPKGVLLAGVPGCGKSLSVKAISADWQFPCLRFDLGKVFGQYVGQSENNIRQALKVAESVAPCVLWIDEIEKGFAGTGGGGALDSGVTARVFGTFLSWMQEKKKPVFVAATANDVSGLPPEFLRKGRFDELFFVDLPQAGEREEIFKIHLEQINKRRQKAVRAGASPVNLLDLSAFDLTKLSQATEGYTGADIAGIVISALEDALSNGHDVTMEDVIKQVEVTVPLSSTMKEKIEELREWGEKHARPASTSKETVPVKTVEQMKTRKIQF